MTRERDARLVGPNLGGREQARASRRIAGAPAAGTRDPRSIEIGFLGWECRQHRVSRSEEVVSADPVFEDLEAVTPVP